MVKLVDRLRTQSIPSIITCIRTRFESFQNPANAMFDSMKWVDPANWSKELDQLKLLATHFKDVLGEEFKEEKLKVEWKDLMVIVCHYYSGARALPLWSKIINYRRSQFPNLCMLAEVVLAVGVSNSIVEGGFSILSSM